ncbi:MAG: hypothetical protein JNL66_20840 [Alphaproteobacteria bacterium]|nr:hypothetical protein [Alphaproteobacteria bacterium]
MAIAAAGLFLLSGCAFLRGAGDVAREVAEGVHGVVFVATAPVWLPAYVIAARPTCPPMMRGAMPEPPARTDVDAFSVRRLPPLPSPAGLSDPAAFALVGPGGAISAGPDPSTVIVSRHDISTVLLLPKAPAGQPRWQHFEYAAATDG